MVRDPQNPFLKSGGVMPFLKLTPSSTRKEPGMSGRNVFFLGVAGVVCTAVLSCEKPAIAAKTKINTDTERNTISTFKIKTPKIAFLMEGQNRRFCRVD